MALITCPECGKKVSDSAEVCPYCGKTINVVKRLSKSILYSIFFFVLVIVLLVSYCVYNAYQNIEKEKHADIEISSLLLPYEENKFIEIYKQYRDEEKKVSNDIQRASLLNDRTRALKSFVINEGITNWIGKLSKIKQFDENNMGVAIDVYPNLHLFTVIPNDSQFIDRMASLKTNQHVVFSGKFRDDFVDKKSLSVSERLSSPLYQFILTDIKQYATLLDKKWWDSATLEDLKQEIKRGGNVNAADDATTVLEMAFCNKNPQALDMLKELIKNGVNINAKDKYGRTAFDTNCYNDSPYILDMREELLKHGGQGSIRTILAIESPKMPEMVRQSVKNGADVNSGWSALGGYDGISSLKNVPEIIKLLLENGADINYRPPYKTPYDEFCSRMGFCETPLETALSDNKGYEVIDVLIKNGASVNDISHPQKRTPLMFAVEDTSYDIVNRLIKEGANINDKDDHERTVLMYSLWNSSKDYLKIIETLLKKGADINAKNVYGENALMIAKDEYNSDYGDKEKAKQIISLLKKYGAVEKATDKLHNEMMFKNTESRYFQLLLLQGIEGYLIKYLRESGNQSYSGDLSEYLQIFTPYVPLPKLPVVFNGEQAEFTYEKGEIAANYIGEIRFSIPRDSLQPFLVNQ